MPNKLSLQIFVDKISGFCINVYCGQGKKSEHWPKKKRGGSGNDSIHSRKAKHTMGSRS